MNIIRHWLQHPRARLIALMGLVLVAPLCLRAAMGWSDPLGYLSDLGIGSLLVVLLHRRPCAGAAGAAGLGPVYRGDGRIGQRGRPVAQCG